MLTERPGTCRRRALETVALFAQRQNHSVRFDMDAITRRLAADRFGGTSSAHSNRRSHSKPAPRRSDMSTGPSGTFRDAGCSRPAVPAVSERFGRLKLLELNSKGALALGVQSAVGFPGAIG